MNDNRNLILAIAITMLLLFGFDFYMNSQMEPLPVDEQTAELGNSPRPTGQAVPSTDDSSAPSVVAAPGIKPGLISPSSIGQVQDRNAALAESPRIAIQSPRVSGSIRLKGGRIDDLTLLDYRETLDEASPNIILLSPQRTEDAYFADFGWLSATMDLAFLPRDSTPWTADRETLTPETPVKLTWDNGNGLTFTRIYALDENYMITVTQAVENSSSQTQALWRDQQNGNTGGQWLLHSP